MTRPKPRRQCAKCPWKKSTNPLEIPDGYSVEKHRALVDTIAKPGVLDHHELRIMACHETVIDEEKPCVGWLVNQLGPGNNLALRMKVICHNIDANVETVGEQHKTFADTLPRVTDPDSASSASRRSSQG
jgi:hypothetical protein